jgi:hypothetical protein
VKTVGYSGTPLAKKLGIKPGTKLFPVAAPDNYYDLLAPLPAGVKRVRKIDDADASTRRCAPRWRSCNRMR